MPNVNYPYLFKVEKPPHFWMTERSGKLEAAMEQYFAAEKLGANEVRLIKSYLRQYVERALLAGDANRGALLRSLERLKTTREIEDFSDELANFGVEPF